MQTIWFPAPVCVLFRRLVNVVSTLSLSHQYLSQNGDSKTNWSTLKSFAWLPWANRTGFALALDTDIPDTEKHIQRSPGPLPKPTTNRPLDIIHRLMQSPALYDPIRVPRNPVALCHGAHIFPPR